MRQLYGHLPGNAKLLTIGAGSTELGEVFIDQEKSSLPDACTQLKEMALRLLAAPESPQL